MPISVFLFKRCYTFFWFALCFLNFCPSRLVKYAFLIYCFSIFCFAFHDSPINDTFWVTILTFHILIEDWTSFVNPLQLVFQSSVTHQLILLNQWLWLIILTTIPKCWGIWFHRCTKFQKIFIFLQEGTRSHTTKDTIK